MIVCNCSNVNEETIRKCNTTSIEVVTEMTQAGYYCGKCISLIKEIIENDMNKKIKVFLGGTCNGTIWRDKLISMLDESVDYFNPVVKDWTPECQANEIKEREECDYVLYVITPKMTGVYSIAEVVQDSNIRHNKTLFCVLEQDYPSSGYSQTLVFDEFQMRSLNMVKRLVSENGVLVFDSLENIAGFLNKVSK